MFADPESMIAKKELSIEAEAVEGDTETDGADPISVDWEPKHTKTALAKSAVNNWQRQALIVGAYLIFLVALISASKPGGVGDAAEYLAQADKISHFHRPQIIESDLPRYRQMFDQIGGYFTLGGSDIVNAGMVKAKNGAFVFAHFWSYAALVSPVMGVLNLLDVSPAWAFTIVNCAMLAGGLWIVSRRLNWVLSLLVFAGPVIWWSDKMHSEAFTFSLLATAFAWFRDRPYLAMLAAGLAASQNFPIAVLVGVIAAALVLRDRTQLKKWQFWTAFGGSSLMAVSSVIYYQVMIGEISPQAVNTGYTQRLPSLHYLLAPVIDLNVGVIPAAPIIVVTALVAVALLVWRAPRDSWITIAAGAVTLAWFLIAFSQTNNVNHGATPNMSRYGTWMIPLAVLVLVEAQRYVTMPQSIARIPLPVIGGVLLVASVVFTTIMFSPRLADNPYLPTPIAEWVWANHPAWDNSLPEIFIERNHLDRKVDTLDAYSVADQTCSKALVFNGKWPRSEHCPLTPPPVPEKCLNAKLPLCYANRDGNTYRYAIATDLPAYGPR